MAIPKQITQKCGMCIHIDRETYKGAKTAVCYLLEKKNDKPVAIAVKDSTSGCGHWRENK